MSRNLNLGIARHIHPPLTRGKVRNHFKVQDGGRLGDRVSNYSIGAFEALEWAWHMLRTYRDQPKGVDEARYRIQEVLASMGEGDRVDFVKKMSQVKAI